MLYHLYPEKTNLFDNIESNIYEIVKNIYNCYVKRYIKKNFVTVPTEEFHIMRECHQWHEADRQYNRVTLNKVFEIFNEQNSTNINRMLRRYTIESNQKDVQKDENITRKRSNTVSTNPSPYVNSINNSTEVSPMILPNSETEKVKPLKI
jgi:effector-binding domain-containing protein